MTTTTNQQQQQQLCQVSLSPRPLSMLSTLPEGSNLEQPGLRVCHLLYNSQTSPSPPPPHAPLQRPHKPLCTYLKYSNLSLADR